MNMKNSWNPMLNFISEIKTAYRKKFKREPSLSYNSDIYRSCVEVWVEELGIQKYIDMMDYIETSQKKDYVIFHYINFENFLILYREKNLLFPTVECGIFMMAYYVSAEVWLLM